MNITERYDLLNEQLDVYTKKIKSFWYKQTIKEFLEKVEFLESRYKQ